MTTTYFIFLSEICGREYKWFMAKITSTTCCFHVYTHTAADEPFEAGILGYYRRAYTESRNGTLRITERNEISESRNGMIGLQQLL